MKIRITHSDKGKGLLAGMEYELSAKQAQELIEAQKAVPVEEKPKADPKKAVKHGDG